MRWDTVDFPQFVTESKYDSAHPPLSESAVRKNMVAEIHRERKRTKAKASHSDSTRIDSTAIQPAQNDPLTQNATGESMVSTSGTNTALEYHGANLQIKNFSQPECSTKNYSQSEVDHLLETQAEAMSATFAGKIAAQQKFVQQSILKHEKAMHAMSAELYTSMEQFNGVAGKTAAEHIDKVKTLMEQTQNEIDVQMEQVKADLDRTLMNDLKGFDKRIQRLETNLQSMTENKQSASSQTVTILVALSVVASLANLVMMLVHH